MLKVRRSRLHSLARPLIVGLVVVFVLAACTKVESEDEAQPTRTRQTIAPTEIVVVEAEDQATIPVPEPTVGPNKVRPATEEPPLVEPLTLTAEARPTREEPDEPQTPEAEAAQDFGITEFLREKVSEGKGVWPFVSLDDPVFISADEATHIEPLDLVLGVSINGEHKAYPTSMMWFHHVANDIVGGQPVAVTY